MGKLAILLLTPPYTDQNSESVIRLAKAAINQGHEVIGIYANADGVYNMNNQINPTEKGARNVAELFQELKELGINITCCPICATFRGVKNDDNLIENATFEGLGAFAELALECDKIVAFSSQ
jgi:tRNA 2-thiouridine synthesizing protein D